MATAPDISAILPLRRHRAGESGKDLRVHQLLALLAVAGCFTKPDPPLGVVVDAASPDAAPQGIVYVRGASLAVNVNTVEVTINPPPPPSSTIVVAVCTYQNFPPLITDTAGNIYEIGNNITTPANGHLTVRYAVNAQVANPFRVTATATSAIQVSLAVHVYTGISGFTASSGQSGQSAGPMSGPVPVTANETLVFAALSHDDTVTTTAGPTFTLRQVPTETSAQCPLATEDAIVPGGSASSISPSFILSASSSWGSISAAFAPAM